MNVTIEEWRPSHHPHYDVSNFGRVRSRARSRVPRLLKPGLMSAGYPSVVFGKGHTQLVHRLVATAFIGPCPINQEVRHKNDPRFDASAINLEYGSRTDNILDAVNRGRWDHSKLLTSADIPVIRKLFSYLYHYEIAQLYGVTRQSITAIKLNRNWRH